MKKTLIAAAVAAAVAAPAANAGVQIYGQIHVSIDYLDAQTSEVCSGDGSDTTPGGGFNVCDRTSRIGFKGSEDLGNGLKAIWKMESAVNIADGENKGGSWGGARNAYIGLAGDWGTFLYGRHDTPYKMAFYASGIDKLGDSFMDVNDMYGIVEWRRDNAIAYVSPNWNGLTIAGAVIPAEGSPNPDDDGLADSYSIGVMYSNNGMKLSAGYEDTEGETGLDSSEWMIGAGYTMNAFDISAVYVSQDYSLSNVESNDIWAVSMAYTMGNNKLIATVGQNDWTLTDGSSDDGLGYGLAVQHMFSKRTSAYLGYSSTDAYRLQKTTKYAGTESEAVSFGMIHKF
jgi:predicted porin